MIKLSLEDIASFYLSLSNDTGDFISNLKLQKLVYYSQAWHLAAFKERLFEAEFEAWIHGPVCVELYHKYNHFKWQPILVETKPGLSKDIFKRLSKEQQNILVNVVDEYFGMPAFELERLTHLESPWIIARGDLAPDEPSKEIISDKSIIDFYSKFVVEVDEEN